MEILSWCWSSQMNFEKWQNNDMAKWKKIEQNNSLNTSSYIFS